MDERRRLAGANYPDQGRFAQVGQAAIHRATAQWYASARTRVGARLVQEEHDTLPEDLRAKALAGLAIAEKAEESEADELHHSDAVKAHAIAVIRSDSFPIDVASFSENDLLREAEEYAVGDVASALSLLVSLLQRREHPGQALHLVDREALGLERKDRIRLAEYLERYDQAVEHTRTRRAALLREIDEGVRSAVEARLRPLADGVLANDPGAYLAAADDAEESARQAIGKGLFERQESVQVKRSEAALQARRQVAQSWGGFGAEAHELLGLINKHRLAHLVPELLGIVRRHVAAACGMAAQIDLEAGVPVPLMPLIHESFWQELAADPEFPQQRPGSADTDIWPFAVDGDDPIGGRLHRRAGEWAEQSRRGGDPRIEYSDALAAVTQVLLSQHVYRGEALERLAETERKRREYTPWIAARQAVRMVFSPLTRTLRAALWH